MGQCASKPSPYPRLEDLNNTVRGGDIFLELRGDSVSKAQAGKNPEPIEVLNENGFAEAPDSLHGATYYLKALQEMSQGATAEAAKKGQGITVPSSPTAQEKHGVTLIPDGAGEGQKGEALGGRCVYQAYTLQGDKGRNQDTYIIGDELFGQPNTLLAAVLDGHGMEGHFVSQTMRDMLPWVMKRAILGESGSSTKAGEGPPIPALADDVMPKKDGDAGGKTEATLETKTSSPFSEMSGKPSADLEGKDGQGAGEAGERKANRDEGEKGKAGGDEQPRNEWGSKAWRQQICEDFVSIDTAVKDSRKLDMIYSGSTCAAALIKNDDLAVMCVGDSRCIIAHMDDSGQIVPERLSAEFKPDHPVELRRILLMGGKVYPHPAEPLLPRFWMPNYDVPGLAMSRALGDWCIKKYGLSAEPSIVTRKITQRDLFMVLCSDGLSDVMNDHDILRLVLTSHGKLTKSAAKRAGASADGKPSAKTSSGISDLTGSVPQLMAQEARKLWVKTFPGSRRDDIAIIVLYLNQGMAGQSAADGKEAAKSNVAATVETIPVLPPVTRVENSGEEMVATLSGSMEPGVDTASGYMGAAADRKAFTPNASVRMGGMMGPPGEGND
eukprot:jgi/Mesvir1/22514/Mv18541-RA.1